jgi:uncharacterized membrane protein YkvA (DUF1232 family)
MAEPQDLADLEGIPEAARALWIELVGEPLRPTRELERDVRDYGRRLGEQSRWRGDDVDLPLAAKLGQALVRLLGTLDDKSPERARRLVQAAVRYYVIEDDAFADQESLAGFDDDAAVINAVLRELGHDRWVVPVR